MNRTPRRLQRPALRTALASTGIVAALMLVLCIGVDLVVAHNLRASAQDRLNHQLAVLASDPLAASAGEPDFDDPEFVWYINSNGVVEASPGAPPLPAGARLATTPQPITIAGTDFLTAGVSMTSGRLVIAESLSSVTRATSTMIVSEALVAPALLALIFVGALVVGRRVAAPIERARRSQLDFTADASHELRTPLSVIEAEASLALAQTADLHSDREALLRVHVEAGRLRRIVNDLLWLARFDALSTDPSRQPVDVATAAAITAERFRAIAGQQHIQLFLDTGGPEAAIIEAPPEWIDRLCGVLLDNACRYTPNGGRVDVRVQRNGNAVRLTVSDTGPGIPTEQRQRIFDRFQRAASDGEGAGLGLAIGDAVVRATRGHWVIDDAAGGGLSIGVVWPAA
jgi:signal transduction histidine kinase